MRIGASSGPAALPSYAVKRNGRPAGVTVVECVGDLHLGRERRHRRVTAFS